jgi:flagellar L-ring protein FlgH
MGSRLTDYLALFVFACAVLALLASLHASAQSSSLYVEEPERVAASQTAPLGVAAQSRGRTVEDPLAPALASYSLVAVTLPEPRRFAVHDLIFVTVRESSESRFDGSLETEKQGEIGGEVTAFPSMTLQDLFELRFSSRELGANRPRVAGEFDKEFEGEGEMTRSDTMTARVAARVIDIRPNGNLILEARKHIRTDEESVTLLLTGTCRPQDVNPDNTLDSFKLYDLHLIKITDGEVRNAAKKGLITKFFDALFNL